MLTLCIAEIVVLEAARRLKESCGLSDREIDASDLLQMKLLGDSSAGDLGVRFTRNMRYVSRRRNNCIVIPLLEILFHGHPWPLVPHLHSLTKKPRPSRKNFLTWLPVSAVTLTVSRLVALFIV